MRPDEEIIKDIKSVLEKNVKDNVAMHGGEVKIIDFEMETGTLRTLLSGSCSGCASSTITLKMGIENMLKHYVPEVNRVTGEDDPNFNDPYYTEPPSYNPMDNM